MSSLTDQLNVFDRTKIEQKKEELTVYFARLTVKKGHLGHFISRVYCGRDNGWVCQFRYGYVYETLCAAMFAAVVAGVHRDIAHAQFVMGKGFEKTYVPVPEQVAIYRKLYVRYQELGKLV